MADDIKTGKVSPDIFEVSYTKLDTGELVTLNNRSLETLEMAGKYPEYAIFVEYEKAGKHLVEDVGLPSHAKGSPVVPTDRIAVTANKDGLGKFYDVEKGKGKINYK